MFSKRPGPPIRYDKAPRTMQCEGLFATLGGLGSGSAPPAIHQETAVGGIPPELNSALLMVQSTFATDSPLDQDGHHHHASVSLEPPIHSGPPVL